ncbi:PucR family transcriptional regulator [Anaerobium acetethylicum]|uniref:Carbohydrate diacid regulator n=1 Tax=Anaerobium acetethylicum TaxID=1619234 RepID=A0A1D3TRM2_9FIRM|nr:helix-turn-helix domain-containing protein [Anaerobium acetethylicum]SCP96383.1 carbohydrate diacid regulator [Anaerobium acetethylicum]
MISNQILQKSIEELRAITRIELSIMDLEGIEQASTSAGETDKKEQVQKFIESQAESQVIQGYHFFKVYDDTELEYVLLSKGDSEDAYMIGKVAVSQIQNLITAYKEKFDKNNFMQNLILDNLLLIDIYNRAKRLHIDAEARRVVFLIETKAEKDIAAMETVKSLYAGNSRDFITAVDEKNIILVKELKQQESYEDIAGTAETLVDMINAEAMMQVRVAYGTIVKEIKDVSKSYKEAKMALDVGKIFYSDRTIIAYNTLGIGRLIYQLPIPLCEMFMKELFQENVIEQFDEETLSTINKFFENNLNVSETSRQLFIHRNTLVYRIEKLQKATGLDIRIFDDALTFKIALMVSNYMKYVENREF